MRALLLTVLVACGPSVAGTGTDAGVDASDATPRPDADPTKASIEGHVWAPNLAPGVAPKGQEMPVFDALVLLSPERLPAIQAKAYCERCIDVPANGAASGHD